jgi:hypothetical protein
MFVAKVNMTRFPKSKWAHDSMSMSMSLCTCSTAKEVRHCCPQVRFQATENREWSLRRSCAGRHGVKYQQNGDDWRIELFVCDVRVSFRFDGLAVVNDAHLLISALNITMSQRKSVLHVSNITSTVPGVSLGKFIGIKYRAWYLPPFSSNLAVSSVM